MENTENGIKSWRVFLFMLAVLTTAVGGCQMGTYLPGAGMVDQDYWIPLQTGETQSGTWDGMYVAIKYKYVRDGNKLKLQGVVRYADKIVNNYTGIDYFHLDALFLDPQGKVIETQGLASDAGEPLGPSSADPSVYFKKESILPANTVSMAFSYKGQAVASDDGTGGPRYFWEYPVH